ncbi:hypothetical protein Rsub_08285 [Raphidocelis subcapitata]|uniref:TLDc domain-containing protein n=1 Tax=Raphidocelis subcapitata TaxID=307507 RepID=A0A2V0P5V3_9CHLO|nr:hypothetical protein Rsub_08285 [Raphidocelis subcapitata]|eukprot:GBF95254.1 hypothetical protein Rsub_08285 [Raphidocelis subcapitata]
MLGYCAGAFSWLLGCGAQPSAAYTAAAALFSPDELAALRAQYHARAAAAHGRGVDQRQLLDWCSLGAGAPPALADGLFAAVLRSDEDGSGGDGGGGVNRGAEGESAALRTAAGGGGGGGGAGAAPVLVALEDLVVAKARAERQGDAAAAEFCFDVLDREGRGVVTGERLAAVVEALLRLSLPPRLRPTDAQGSAAAIAAGALTLAGGSLGPGAFDLPALRKAAARAPALLTLLRGLLAPIGAPGTCGATGQQAAAAEAGGGDKHSCAHAAPLAVLIELPELIWGANGGPRQQQQQQQQQQQSKGAHSKEQQEPGGGGSAGAALPRDALLRPEWVWLLAPGLAPDLRREWRLLFSSARHGASFSTLLARLGDAAPTLLLVRDSGGHLFGGVAHAPWRRSGAFFGDYANKLLSLLPAACTYPASGINANLQWCGTNFAELPNGLGMGGQLLGGAGHFGLYLDATLDAGHSRPNATYASPCLSSGQAFAVDAVEVWALRPPEEEEGGGGDEAAARRRGGGASILSRAQEDQKLLELAGVRANWRAGVPDEPLDE